MQKLLEEKKACRLCGSKNITVVINLTPTPLANDFVKREFLDKPQERFPLNVFLCENCKSLQLQHTVDPGLLFKHYVYVSGTSPSFVNHFKKYADSLMKKFSMGSGNFVVEIGSNDGTLLKCFQEKGIEVLGIDPAIEISAEANKKGIETIPDFFTRDNAEKIKAGRGEADLIIANNVFAHIDDLQNVVEAVKILLKDNGVFVFEVSYFANMYQDCLFDMIYHEHLFYHTIKPLQIFFESNGMKIIDVEKVSTHGGSIRCSTALINSVWEIEKSVAEFINYEKHLGFENLETYINYNENINKIKSDLNSLLKELKDKGKSIAGYGAPAKATTFLYHFELENYLNFIVDDSPWKQNLYSPGLHIPIVNTDYMYKNMPDYILILAWNFSDPIIKNNTEYLNKHGKFIIPLPEIKVVNNEE